MMGMVLLRRLLRWEAPIVQYVPLQAASCFMLLLHVWLHGIRCIPGQLIGQILHLEAQAGKGKQQSSRGPDATAAVASGSQPGAESQRKKAQKQAPAAKAGAARKPEDAEASGEGGDGADLADLQPGAAVQPPAGGAASAAQPAHVDTTVFVRGLPLDILQYELQVGGG